MQNYKIISKATMNMELQAELSKPTFLIITHLVVPIS
jgi:hypothetical protein